MSEWLIAILNPLYGGSFLPCILRVFVPSCLKLFGPAISQHQLQIYYIQPSAKFESNLAQMGGLFEAELEM